MKKRPKRLASKQRPAPRPSFYATRQSVEVMASALRYTQDVMRRSEEIRQACADLERARVAWLAADARVRRLLLDGYPAATPPGRGVSTVGTTTGSGAEGWLVSRKAP